MIRDKLARRGHVKLFILIEGLVLLKLASKVLRFIKTGPCYVKYINNYTLCLWDLNIVVHILPS